MADSDSRPERSSSEASWDDPEVQRAAYRVGMAVLQAAADGRTVIRLPDFDAFNREMQNLKGEDQE